VRFLTDRVWRRSGRDAIAARFPPPSSQWTDEYAERHAEFVSYALDSSDLLGRFARRRRLPRGYGVGLDERVVEYPGTRAQGPADRTLDAGSTLNHAHVLDRFQPRVAELDIVTLAAEPVSFPERGISYVYEDLRALSYDDDRFDTVVSISTLEHVGMETALYGIESPRAADPTRELHRALSELVRVLAPGGMLLVTVPYGAAEDHGWFRQLDAHDVNDLVSFAGCRRVSIAVYRYAPDGWQVSDLERAAGSRYHDHRREPRPAPDLAAAARAVACLRFDF
jgi:SAM-dependent methyltransferase